MCVAITLWAGWQGAYRHGCVALKEQAMTTPTDIKHIVRDSSIYGGKPCIEGHRVAVHDIAVSHQQGYTPDRIASELFPGLTLAQVHAALLYYYEHQSEIDREIAEDAAEIATQARTDQSPLARRVRQAIRAHHERETGA
jgi:uncharacterized protein (DUF433 family)